MSIRIATITFNHAHNHGSMLQTYALQQYVKRLSDQRHRAIDYAIIDYYAPCQKRLYSIYRGGVSFKSLVKNVLALIHSRALRERYAKYEDFMHQHCSLTTTYHSISELEDKPPLADVYISGSDQIWNVRAKDFSDAFFLPFVNSGKRVSYAASFGPLWIDWTQYQDLHIERYLQQYDCISVREEGSADNVAMLTGKRPLVHLDPTFLLSKGEWRKIQSDANYRNGQYILLYCLEPSKLQLAMARAIAKKIGLPIVVLRYNNRNDWFNKFVHRYDAGPKDFLSYIDHAALVLSSSFHGTAFSLIYHKPFYVFNGLSDNRISSILQRVGLMHRSLEHMEDIEHVSLEPVKAESIEDFLDKERKRSASYLTEAIGL